MLSLIIIISIIIITTIIIVIICFNVYFFIIIIIIIIYLFIDLVKVPTEEKHMHVYNKEEQLCTYVYIYYVSLGYNLYSGDQPANNGFVIVQIIG